MDVPSAPPGFGVDVLIPGLVDGVTPQIASIRNPAFGTGVILATLVDSQVVVRRIDPAGSLEIVSSFEIDVEPGEGREIRDIAFDSVGFLGGDLVVSVRVEGTCTLYRVSPDGSSSPAVTLGNLDNWLSFSLGFAGTPASYPVGLYLFDAFSGPEGNSSIWRWNTDGSLEELFESSIVNNPPGRVDMDPQAISWDSTSIFDGGLVVGDNDANQSGTAGVYEWHPVDGWSTIYGPFDTDDVGIRDFEIVSSGAFGGFAYLMDPISDSIARLAPDGSRSELITGLDVSSDVYVGDGDSFSVDDSGSVMYIADGSGLFRVRPIDDLPGPSLLATEPRREITHRDSGGITSMRLIWDEPIAFEAGDLTVTDGDGSDVPFATFGSGTQFMLISLVDPLIGGELTVSVGETVFREGTSIPIDGDGDGIAGGPAIMTFRHSCATDIDRDGKSASPICSRCSQRSEKPAPEVHVLAPYEVPRRASARHAPARRDTT